MASIDIEGFRVALVKVSYPDEEMHAVGVDKIGQPVFSSECKVSLDIKVDAGEIDAFIRKLYTQMVRGE